MQKCIWNVCVCVCQVVYIFLQKNRFGVINDGCRKHFQTKNLVKRPFFPSYIKCTCTHDKLVQIRFAKLKSNFIETEFWIKFRSTQLMTSLPTNEMYMRIACNEKSRFVSYFSLLLQNQNETRAMVGIERVRWSSVWRMNDWKRKKSFDVSLEKMRNLSETQDRSLIYKRERIKLFLRWDDVLFLTKPFIVLSAQLNGKTFFSRLQFIYNK